jgi:hypothetical protein
MVKRKLLIVMTKLECTYNRNHFGCVGVFMSEFFFSFVFSVCLYHTSFVHRFFLYTDISMNSMLLAVSFSSYINESQI